MFGKLTALHDFLRQPAAALLGYPDAVLSQERVCELLTLGVLGVYDFGPKRIGQWHCLGVGYCGLVLLVQCRGQMAALKARRTDATQTDFEKETKGLAIANQAKVGPQLLAHTQNFLLMDYAPGRSLSPWLAESPARDIALKVIQDLLNQAFRLDQSGLDHGNLRCVTSHVVVADNQPILLDFSSASCDRRAANVTTLTQGLFWGTIIAQQMKAIGIAPDRERCIQQLRGYKQAPTVSNFQSLLALLA